MVQPLGQTVPDTTHLFRDCYNNGINIENKHDVNDTDVPTEDYVPRIKYYYYYYTELCALVNKPSGASAGASDLKY